MGYVSPIANVRSNTIRVLAVNDTTIADIYCNNMRETYSIGEGRSVMRTFGSKDNCAIISNKKVLVIQVGNNSDGHTVLTMIIPGVLFQCA